MDRLLGQIVVMPINDLKYLQELLAAQLAKTDKEWVEWAFETCMDDSHSSGYWTKDCKLMIHQHRCECDECWQERKRSIGI